jgi:hypothetical protein
MYLRPFLPYWIGTRLRPIDGVAVFGITFPGYPRALYVGSLGDVGLLEDWTILNIDRSFYSFCTISNIDVWYLHAQRTHSTVLLAAE